MGNYKKNVRPLNKAKNLFVKWLKDSDGRDIDNDKPQIDKDWDYYCVISGFIEERLYTVHFECWRGRISIDYDDDDHSCNKLSVDEFMQLMNF